MTKNVAWFVGEDARQVVGRILSLGLTLRNPVSGIFQAFSSGGEEVLMHDESEALEFLLRGNGVALWITGDHDLFLYLSSGTLCASFDGFTESEEAAMVSRLRSVGLKFVVAHEEEPPP